MPFEQHDSVTTTLGSDEEGNLLLDFPEEILEAASWKEGDSLSIEAFAGRIILRKLEPKGKSK
jgi:hypothetical protein